MRAMAADHTIAATMSPPSGLPASRPQTDSVVGANGWCSATTAGHRALMPYVVWSVARVVGGFVMGYLAGCCA